MVSEDAKALLRYQARFLLYIAHTIVLTSTLVAGLVVITAVSIGVAWVADAAEASILLVVPILGMATYLAQDHIESWNEGPPDPEYDDITARVAADSFAIVYFNVLFLLSVLLGVLVGPALASVGVDVATVDPYLLLGFSYPILDIVMFRRWTVSPAAVPVAVSVQLLHRAGKVTWFRTGNVNIERVPLVDLFIEQRTPPLD